MRYFATAAALAALAIIPVLGADSMTPDKAKDKLVNAEVLAREIRDDATTLQSYVRFSPNIHFRTHERNLSMMEDNAEHLGEIVQELHRNRSGLAAWQTELVNRLIMRMDVLTDNISRAIKFIEEHPEGDFTPTYADFIDGAQRDSSIIARSVSRYMEFGAAERAKNELMSQRTQ